MDPSIGDGARRDGLRQARRMSNWTAAALIAGTGVAAVALAHQASVATPAAATGNAAAGAAPAAGNAAGAGAQAGSGPQVTHSVATTTASGVTVITTTRTVNGKTIVTRVRHAQATADN